MDTIDLPDKFPRTISLQDAEKILDAFGYEIVLKRIPKPEPKPAIGFGHTKGETS